MFGSRRIHHQAVLTRTSLKLHAVVQQCLLCALLVFGCIRDALRTHTTGPEYATKHRQRTQQAQLNHCV
jgi:hypothetical protein